MHQHRYPRKCFLMLKSFDDAGRTCWATQVKHLLFEYGFGLGWISQDAVSHVNIIKYDCT